MTNLSVVNYIERINRTYRFIRMESTGSLSELGRQSAGKRENHQQLSGGTPVDGSGNKVQQGKEYLLF